MVVDSYDLEFITFDVLWFGRNGCLKCLDRFDFSTYENRSKNIHTHTHAQNQQTKKSLFGNGHGFI